MRSLIYGFAVCGFALCACVDEANEGTRTDAGDAHTPADARATSDGGDPKDAARPDSTGTASCEAAVQDAALDTSQPDAAVDGDAGSECDDAFLFESGEDAPPSYCVPPCIWNAMRACATTEAAHCVEQAGFFGFPIVCDPEAGWASELQPRPSTFMARLLRQRGAVCLAASYGGSIVGGPGEFRQYQDRAGALAFGDPTSSIVCSRSIGLLEFMRRPRDAGLPACSREYRLEPSRPECAKWTSLLDLEPVCGSRTPGSCACL